MNDMSASEPPATGVGVGVGTLPPAVATSTPTFGRIDRRRAPRGRKAVEERLIEAAAEGLAEIGPKQLSIRIICQRARVNPGQVYHYFGSKRALLAAAMRRLASEHYANASTRAGGESLPPALSLAEDVRYWKAVCHVLLDGEIDLARIELEEGISVPRRALSAITDRRGGDLDMRARARFAALVTLQLGWVAFEEFAFAVLETEDPACRDEIRREIARLADELHESTIDGVPTSP